MKTVYRLAGMALLLTASASHAAKPTSIVFESNAQTADGRAYAQFTVKCNDGRNVALTAWDGRRKWCVGDIGATVCEKKQISAAKTACMPS